MYQICVLTWCAQQQQSRPSSQSVRKVYPQSTASNERHGDSRDELERLAERIEGVEDAKLWPENRSNQMQRVLNLRLKELETAYDNLHDACAKKPKSITSSAHSSPQSPPCHTENCLQERRLRERRTCFASSLHMSVCFVYLHSFPCLGVIRTLAEPGSGH